MKGIKKQFETSAVSENKNLFDDVMKAVQGQNVFVAKAILKEALKSIEENSRTNQEEPILLRRWI